MTGEQVTTAAVAAVVFAGAGATGEHLGTVAIFLLIFALCRGLGKGLLGCRSLPILADAVADGQAQSDNADSEKQ
jgi:hypothetical protein